MKKDIIRVIISLILFVCAIAIIFENSIINNVIFTISYIIVGFEVLEKAIKNIFKGEVFDENFLMSIATIGAFIIGEYPEAVAVMLFYQVGELFQDYAVDKSKKSISNLMEIRPDYANLENGEKVDPNTLKIGDIIIIKPGEKVPVDGVVIDGESMIDTMALTGESVPRKVEKNQEILSGCINKQGLLKVRVAKEFGESTISKILDLVENASNKKAKSENFITKFAKFYTPIVVIIAVFLAIIPTLVIKDTSFLIWVYRALSFLVVSCPCALVISIPLSFFGGIGGASKMGVLIKGGNYLEALSNAKTVVFDKTGTLTQGVFEIQKIEANDIDENELIKLVVYAEKHSNHPIANAIKKYYNEDIDESKIEKVEELSGKGIFAIIDGKEVLVGNEKLMQDREINHDQCKEVGTILYVAVENKFAGVIIIADKIKEDSFNAIKLLKKSGISKTVMLTGDRKEVAEDVSKKLGIDEVYSELLPDGKVKEVEELIKGKSQKEKLVFVGDGINDAPVLAISDIGVAMGGLGSDAAIEASDIVIMTDEISKLGSAIKLSKKTMRIVKENITFAIFVKIVVLILSALGISTMWEAVFADVGVTIIAVINAFRVLHFKSK